MCISVCPIKSRGQEYGIKGAPHYQDASRVSDTPFQGEQLSSAVLYITLHPYLSHLSVSHTATSTSIGISIDVDIDRISEDGG